MIDAALLSIVLEAYALPWDGLHGVSHWARVLENGRRLAKRTGANVKVVELFALFHDARRANEGWDQGHGRRGAEYATTLRGTHFHLADVEFDLLVAACRFHTDGETTGDVTVRTCWDADRLDLGRAHIAPDPRYLCTDAARDPRIIAWAEARSRARHVPKWVREEWGVELESRK